MIRLHIERLPEGVYLATSDDLQGLLAQGDTIEETIEIARDVARIILEMRDESAVVDVIEEVDVPIFLAA